MIYLYGIYTMYYVLENIYRKLSFNLCHADPRRSGKAAGRQRVRCRMAGRRLAPPVARGRLSAFAAARARQPRPASPPARRKHKRARTRFEQFLFFCNKTFRTRLVTSY